MATPTDIPPCCKNRGLFFPDRGKRCPRHQSAEDKTLVADLDRQAKPIIGGARGWPYGPNIDVRSRAGLVEWAESYGLKLARSSRSCTHWLRGERCSERDAHGDQRGGWRDHVTCWTYAGEPAVVLAHPYGLQSDDVASLGTLAAQDDLEVFVSGKHWCDSSAP